jgi:hypothetical protein
MATVLIFHPKLPRHVNLNTGVHRFRSAQVLSDGGDRTSCKLMRLWALPSLSSDPFRSDLPKISNESILQYYTEGERARGLNTARTLHSVQSAVTPRSGAVTAGNNANLNSVTMLNKYYDEWTVADRTRYRLSSEEFILSRITNSEPSWGEISVRMNVLVNIWMPVSNIHVLKFILFVLIINVLSLFVS